MGISSTSVLKSKYLLQKSMCIYMCEFDGYITSPMYENVLFCYNNFYNLKKGVYNFFPFFIYFDSKNTLKCP